MGDSKLLDTNHLTMGCPLELFLRLFGLTICSLSVGTFPFAIRKCIRFPVSYFSLDFFLGLSELSNESLCLRLLPSDSSTAMDLAGTTHMSSRFFLALRSATVGIDPVNSPIMTPLVHKLAVAETAKITGVTLIRRRLTLRPTQIGPFRILCRLRPMCHSNTAVDGLV